MNIYGHVLDTLAELAAEVEAYRNRGYTPEQRADPMATVYIAIDQSELAQVLRALETCHDAIGKCGPQV